MWQTKPGGGNKVTRDQDYSNGRDDDKHDLYHTIEFTDEDKAKLLRPNVQPMDDDYFAKEVMNEDTTDDPSEFREDSLSEPVDQGINEFRYSSIRDQLERERLEEEERKSQAQKERFSNLFPKTYEDEYDLEQLDDLTDYNQFKQASDKVTSTKKDNFFDRMMQKFKSDTMFDNRDEDLQSSEQEEEELTTHRISKEDLKENSFQKKVEFFFNKQNEETAEQTRDKDLEELSDRTLETSGESEPEIHQIEKSEDPSEVIDHSIDSDEGDDPDIEVEEQSPSQFEEIINKGKASVEGLWSKVSRLYSGEEYDVRDLREDDQDEIIEEEPETIEASEDMPEENLIDKEVEEDKEDVIEELKETQEDVVLEDELVEDELTEDESKDNLFESSDISDSTSEPLTSQQEEQDDEEDLSQELEDSDDSFDVMDDAVLTLEYSPDEIEALSDEISSDAQEIMSTQDLTDVIVQDAKVTEALITTNMTATLEEDDSEDSSDEDSRSILGGATWLTIGSFISRVIGALYVIPWSSMFGEAYVDVNSLYSIGYRPYTLFLAIATAGFPSAIAKQMSYYHSQKEYRVADKLFKNSMYIMIGTGLVSALLLYATAPGIAAISSTNDTAAATLVIRSLTPALLILPAMSLLRGYFQGFNDMKPTAISQIIEQISRVAYLLIATYAVLMIMRGTVTTAIVQSTFAAFIGALASLIYLGFLYWRSRGVINQLIETSKDEVDLDLQASIKIMVKDSIPFILLGSGIIMAQFIDQITFSQIMQSTSSMLFSEITQLFGTLSVDVDKLVMIIVSIAVALASSLVPTITAYFSRKNFMGTSQIIVNVMILFSFVMIPAALGMASVSDNIYYFFFANGLDAGPNLLITGAISSIVLGAFTVISTILQSMNFRRVAVRFLVVGIIIKLLLQYPLVGLFNAHGALIATALGLGVATVLMWIKIHRELEIDYERLVPAIIKIVIGSVLMAISATMWNKTLNAAFGMGGRGLMFGKIFIVIIMAVLVYGIAMALTGMLNVIIGEKYQDLQDRMRIL